MNQTQAVIVYRNQTEQAIDQFLYQDGGSLYLFILLCAFVAAIAAMSAAEKVLNTIAYRRRGWYDNIRNTIGAIAFATTVYLMWI